MKKAIILSLAALCINCSSGLPICEEAMKTRIDSGNARREQKAILESKAAGLEEACAPERERSFKKFKDDNQKKCRSNFI